MSSTAVRRWPRVVAVAILLGGFAAVRPALAARRFAETGDAVARVTQLNREALAAIDKREFEKARELLKKALELCDSGGLAQHPIAARTHVHMGVVILEGFKNRELGLKQFAVALAIEPGIALTPSLATSELTEAFEEAKSGGNSGASAAGGETSGVAETPPARGQAQGASAGGGFTYHMVSEAKQGHAIKITVNVDESLKFHKVVLAYRPLGASEFFGREMEPSGQGAYTAEIPDRATTGASIAYYIEAQDEDGRPVANRGTEERPLVIPLGGDRARGSEAAARKGAKKSDDDDTTEVVAEGGPSEGQTAHPWFASVLVGGGFGTVSGHGELNADTPVTQSVSAALLGQLSPEIGHWVSPNLMLSGQARVQVVTGPTEIDAGNRVYSPVSWAFALFAKASWFFGTGDFRPYLSGGLGGGQIRHVVTFDALKDCGPARNQTCVDSVVAGPALAELGGGLFYELGDSFGIVAGTNLQLAAPKFTANVDLNAGVAFGF